MVFCLRYFWHINTMPLLSQWLSLFAPAAYPPLALPIYVIYPFVSPPNPHENMFLASLVVVISLQVGLYSFVCVCVYCTI